MSERSRAFGAIILCMFFWGVSFVSTKIVGAVFPPMSIGALRFILACGFLAVLRLRSGKIEKLIPRDIPVIAGAGLLGITFYFWCENSGLALISASEASIITGAIPALSMIAEEAAEQFSRSRGKAPAKAPCGRARLRRWGGAFISMAGVWLVAKVSLEARGNLKGYLFMAGSCLCWVAYNFFIKALTDKRSRIYIVFWQSLAGLVGFLPFAAMEIGDWGRPGPAALGHLIFLGICCSALGYWLYARAIAVLGIGLSSLFINFIPVITVITGMLLLGERLSPLQWLGAALTLGGVYLAMSAGS